MSRQTVIIAKRLFEGETAKAIAADLRISEASISNQRRTETFKKAWDLLIAKSIDNVDLHTQRKNYLICVEVFRGETNLSRILSNINAQAGRLGGEWQIYCRDWEHEVTAADIQTFCKQLKIALPVN